MDATTVFALDPEQPLVYVDAAMPGLTRVRRGEGFAYRDPKGRWVRDAAQLARIRKLAIPPAYTDVWICPLPHGHLQATGIDARGRKQYRYHDDWRRQRDASKFDRLLAFARVLPRIRARVARDMTRGPLSREGVLATVVRLLDETCLRVGNEAYASANDSYGLTTLRNRHAKVEGATLRLRFKGKSGVLHEARVSDRRVTRVVRRCQQLPGQELFQYQDADGEPRAISSTDVNDYLREAAGIDGLSAKDFRTWHGTVQALELVRLAHGAVSAAMEQAAGMAGAPSPASPPAWPPRGVVEAVARQLGNTPTVCRKAYIHPAILSMLAASASAPDPKVLPWRAMAEARPRKGLRAAEGRLAAFLAALQRGGRRRRRGSEALSGPA